MSMPTVDHPAFQHAYADVLKHGSGLYETRLFDRVMQARTVRHSDVFRFRFIPGKSHAHSRKIWRERSRRSFAWSTVRLTYDLPNLSPEAEKACQEQAGLIAARMSAWNNRMLFHAIFGREQP